MTLTRRHALQKMALASTAAILSPGMVTRSLGQASPPPSGPAVPFSLPPLPYAFNALEPYIDTQTMEIHYGRHHAGYVRKLNQALATEPAFASRPLESLLESLDTLPESIREAVRNNGGGHYNHTLFWNSLTPAPQPIAGQLEQAVTQTFGDTTGLASALKAGGSSVFGSGWVWLVAAPGGALEITTTPNQDTPLMNGQTPILGIDVWEHAYYLHYQNRRSDYLDAIMNIINWPVVGERYDSASGT